jgi:hypothetical protein
MEWRFDSSKTPFTDKMGIKILLGIFRGDRKVYLDAWGAAWGAACGVEFSLISRLLR